jgi:hypothetical protein
MLEHRSQEYALRKFLIICTILSKNQRNSFSRGITPVGKKGKVQNQNDPALYGY